MNRRFALAGILTATALSALSLAKPSWGQETKIVIGSFSRAIDYSPYIVARHNGWLDEAAKRFGKTVEYVEFQTLPSINESLASNRLDVIFEAEPPAIIAAAAGIDLKIVSPGVSLVQEILVHTDSTIQSISDLKGHKIAVPFGSSSHYGVVKLLEKSGIPRSQVSIVDMSPQDGKAAFDSKQVDAWAIWPPFVEQEQASGTGRTMSDSEVFIQSIIAMRGGFVRDNRQLAIDIVGAIRKAQKWIVENPTEAKTIVAKSLGISEAVVDLAWPKHNFTPNMGEKELLDIEEKARFLHTGGFVHGDVDVRKSLVDLLP